MSDHASIKGFLLTRHWRDTPDGIELCFWFNTAQGPVQTLIPATKSVCFLDRPQARQHLQDVERKEVNLLSLAGQPVDAMYFPSHKQMLQRRDQLLQANVFLMESDIKPTDRYLMERFVTAGACIEGKVSAQGNFLRVDEARLKSCDYQPDLKILSLDIETNGFDGQIYSVGLHSRDLKCVLMVGRQSSTRVDEFELHMCQHESALLQQLVALITLHNPDVLIGWNIVNFDLTQLEKRARHCGVPWTIGRGDALAAVLAPSRAGQPAVARIPGRVVLDGVDLLRAGFWQFESYSLENVAQQLLGTGKLVSTSGLDKVREINRLFVEDKPALAAYNYLDCKLVTEIFEKAHLIEFAIERSRLTGLAIDRNGGSVAAFDFLYLPRLHRKGYVATDTITTSGAGSPGGYVIDSRPGLYDNVLLLDFKSLYPSIIRTFHIDPLGMAQPGEDPIPGFEQANFSREAGILPDIIEALWSERDRAKAEHNAPLSQAIKIIMNSFYGVLGTSGCRFHDPRLTSSITRRGHEIIQRSRDFLEERHYPVIYGDTDSLFVLLGDGLGIDACRNIGETLMHELNQWWQQILADEYRLTSYLEVEFETHFQKFLLPTIRGMSTGSKKRYAGLTSGGKLVIKGLEAVRTDWTPLARSFQRELLQRLFTNTAWESLVHDTVAALWAGELDEQLVYRKRLRKPVETYTRNVPPHVQAARKMKSTGRWVRYVITANGPEPVDRQSAPINYQHYIDKQLAPAADTILYFLETDFARVASPQMQMF